MAAAFHRETYPSAGASSGSSSSSPKSSSLIATIESMSNPSELSTSTFGRPRWMSPNSKMSRKIAKLFPAPEAYARRGWRLGSRRYLCTSRIEVWPRVASSEEAMPERRQVVHVRPMT